MKLFKEIHQDTIDLAMDIHRNQDLTFLIPTRFFSAENAQLAMTLNAFVNYGKEKKISKGL